MKFNQIKRQLLALLDGSYEIGKDNRFPTSWEIGLCHIDFIDGRLHLHCRRLGILIGKAGSTIDVLEKELECRIVLHEVDLELDKTSLVPQSEVDKISNLYEEIVDRYKSHLDDVDELLEKLNLVDYVKKS